LIPKFPKKVSSTWNFSGGLACTSPIAVIISSKYCEGTLSTLQIADPSVRSSHKGLAMSEASLSPLIFPGHQF
jgi:hypothetical protein